MKNILLVALVVGMALTLNAEPDGLTTLRTTYSDQLAKIGDEEMASVATAQEQYLAALTALGAQFQQLGKLEPLLKAKKEGERFAATRKVEASDVSSNVPEIATLQKVYMSKIKSAPIGPAQRRLALAGFYERSLQKLEAELTKLNDITGAIDVKKEKDGLAKRPEIVGAKAIVDEATEGAVAKAKKPASAIEVPKVAAPSSSAFVSKTKIESDVKKRFKGFIDAVEDQDWDDALEFVDPNYLRKTGEQVASSVLKMKFSMARIVGDNPTAKFRVESIEISEEGDELTLTPELWSRNKSHSMEKMTWVSSDGEWYLSFGPNAQQDKRNKTADKIKNSLRQKRRRR